MMRQPGGYICESESERLIKGSKDGGTGDAMEMSEEELIELDRENIRMEMRAAGLPVDEEEVEKLRIAMLKAMVLRTIASAALVPEMEDEEKIHLLEAIYTNALASLL